MIRYASLDDLDNIMKIVDDSIYVMAEENNFQWNSDYPTDKDFINDITNKTLYVFYLSEENIKNISGFVCLNFIEPPEYSSVNWSSPEKALVFHRMAVSPNFRGLNISNSLFEFAENLSLEKSCNYLKSDTCSTNKIMNTIFQKRNFTKKGEVFFENIKEPFNCYEKFLT